MAAVRRPGHDHERRRHTGQCQKTNFRVSPRLLKSMLEGIAED
jgi:hypothetical protein